MPNSPSPSDSDRDRVAALIAGASLPVIPGLLLDLRLVEPGHAAWHLCIQCAQLTTCHILPLAFGSEDVRRALMVHYAVKIAAAWRN